ncbi:MAG: hypothetical protein ABSB76_14620 [Streptosporangiaceae bacterium]|jgi:hypothetical protein
MSSDHEAEIRASVAAHQDLGSGYDEAVAEGLVERIGAEIDKRIDARLGSAGTQLPPVAGPGAPAGSPGAAGPGYHGYQAPAGYQGYQGYVGPMLPPGYQLGPPPVRPPAAGPRNVATTITALGSMGLGVAATAIVSRGSNSGAQAVMVLLIWAAIAVINIAYARRH